MAVRIEETFQVNAPVDRVWRYLIDPRQVVECLPGAELSEEQADRVYLGKVKVKVGPVLAAYNGRAQLTEIDEAAHRVRIVAEGREASGAGSAKMTMISVVKPSDGGCEVRVEADVHVAGKIVSFGRGMIEAVNQQLFRQFSECVRTRLESAVDTVAAASLKDTLESAAAPSAIRAELAASAAARRAAAPALSTRTSGSPPQRTAEPVHLLPLVLRALWSSIARLFGRKERR
jgi:carbon monoxide dehydrogenase subunit G